jgi:hypothetical protein
MPLTPEEERELAALESEVGAAPSAGALTPEEEAELAALEAEDQRPKLSKFESLASGFSQGASFGFADEISAGIEAMLDSGKTYEEALAENRKIMEKGFSANPKTALAGEVLGGVTSTLPLGGAGTAAKGVPTLAKAVKTGAKIGAGVGGLTAAGKSEKEITDSDFWGEVVVGTGTGAALGAGGAAIGSALQKGGSAIKGAFKKGAQAADEVGEAASTASGKMKRIIDDADEMIDELDDFIDDLFVTGDTFDVPQAKVTPEAKRLAEFGGYKTEIADDAAKNVAYVKNRIDEGADLLGPTRLQLDPRAPNNLSKTVMKHFNETAKRVKGYEEATTEMLDGIRIPKQAVLKPFQDAIGRLTGTGTKGRRLYTPDNEGAIAVLKKYLQGTDDMMGVADAPSVIDALDVRTFLRDLRAGNVRAYDARGVPLKVKASELKSVAAELRQALRAAVKKQKGGAKKLQKFDAIMDEYAKDYGALTTIKKAWRWDSQQKQPGLEQWYRQRVIYPFQNIADGTTPQPTALAKALQHIGKKGKTPINYAQTVKDNLLVSDLFPELGGGINSGTATRVWTKTALKAGLKSPVAPIEAAKELGGVALDASSGIRRDMLKKILQGQKGLASGTEEFVGRVRDIAGRTKQPLLSAGEMAGEAGEVAGRGVNLAGILASRFAPEGSLEDLPQEKAGPGGNKEPDETSRRRSDVLRSFENRNFPGRRYEEGADKTQAPQPVDKTREQPSTLPRYYPSPAKMGKYSTTLKRAEEKGEEALGATHYILMQRDPEYRKKYEAGREE